MTTRGPHQLPLTVNGADLIADLAGVLWWPARATLVVADLHFEKGSGYAAKGRLLPPYDTAATLERLAAVIRRLEPRRVIALGDSFHDRGAAARLSARDGTRLAQLADGRDWVWITGNHDPAPPATWGGRVTVELVDGPLVFRHEARPGRPGAVAGEVSGHFHPKAAVRVRTHRITAPCFATDGRRLILPAFGAFTGGLNVTDPAIAGLLDRRFAAVLLGRERLYAFPRDRLSPDPDRLWREVAGR
ncbi:MAG: ligase-associated DNA damage response endonuclease PdeM [Azospirillaceae bacterium]